MMMAPVNSRHVDAASALSIPRKPSWPRRDTPRAGETKVTWVGHATFLVEAGGKAILTDPVWSGKLIGGIRRATQPGVEWHDLPPIDAIAISHNHYDHLDWPTIRRLPRDTLCLVPLGLGRWFRRRRFTNVIEHDWWQATRVGTLSVEFVPAHHWSRRGLFDTNTSLWGGWVITPQDGATTYFAGDSGYGDCFAQIAGRHPRIDIALLPIGAYNPRWYLQHVHMDPHEAVQAFGDLNARVMVPMHWGTFRLSHEPILEPMERAERAWAMAGHGQEQFWPLALGESRSLEARKQVPGPRPASHPSRARRAVTVAAPPVATVRVHRFSRPTFQ